MLEWLAQRGHRIKVVVSGRAHRWLAERLANLPGVSLEEIDGLHLSYFGNSLDRSASLFQNLRKAPKSVSRNVEVYRRVVESGFRPDVVVSDFESWAALYALNHRLPVISIDNLQIINRTEHKKSLRKEGGLDFRLAKLAVKIKVPKAYHYLITSFFFPKVRKKYTTLVPPILRPEALSAAPRNAANTSSSTRRRRVTASSCRCSASSAIAFASTATVKRGRDGERHPVPVLGAGFLDDLPHRRARRWPAAGSA